MKYIVDFKNDANQEQIDAWLKDAKALSAKRLTVSSNVFAVECTDQPVIGDIVETVNLDENISTQLLSVVEIIPASTGQMGSFDHSTDWWKTACISDIDFDADTSTYQRRGERTIVYMVDSGVQLDHPEFEGTKVENLFSFDGDFTDTNGHGTSLASLIVGKTLGITDSTLKSVKVFDSSKSTMTSDLVLAFDAIQSDIIANPGSIAVVNLSWTITKNEYVETRIKALIDAGALVVAAAGNSGVPVADITPGSMPEVITIGAYTEEFIPADFSNYTSDIKNTEGSTNYGALDGWAPGTDIRVALVDGSIGTSSGTSVAAAIMSACVAYNSNLFYTSELPVPDAHAHLVDLTLNKSELLILKDQHQASVNRQASFTTHAGTGLTGGSYSSTHLIYANTDVHLLAVWNALTAKVEFDKALPEGLSLSNGWIVGRIANPPVDGTKTLTYLVTVTFDSGAVNTFPMTLYVATELVKPGDTPADITLQSCTITTYCGGTCSGYCYSCSKRECRCSNTQCM